MTCVRRRTVPTRRLDELVIVGRPLDGAPVVLGATAAVVWQALERATSTEELDRRLADAFPDVREDDRHRARHDILRTLAADDLLAPA